jgi:ligand-binding sensor domain-containing protein
MKFFTNRKSRLPNPARVLLFAAVMFLFAVCVLLVTEAGFIYRKTEQALEKERQKQSKQNAIPFSRAPLIPHFNQNIQIIQSTKAVRSVADFQNSLFAATAGGLLQLSENGATVRHFTVSDGLPESDLTALAVFQSKLFIGTKSKGLISFDGEKFESFRLENHETKSITALFAAPQTLFVGTFSGGLLEFDGSKIIETKAADERIEHITFLRQDDAGLMAGTFAAGLWIRQNQIWKRFTTADGLLSNRVTGAEVVDKTLFVATDLGVSQTAFAEILPENQITFRQTFALPALSSLIFENDKFYLTKDNGEVFSFPLKRDAASVSRLNKIPVKMPGNLQSSKLLKTNDAVWFLSNQGLLKSKNLERDEISLAEFGQSPDDNQLSDNNISALAIDRNEQLWIGTFRDGIDVFSADGKKLKHLESETVREINSLTQTAGNKEMLAATSGGAIRFDANFNESFFTKNADLPSRSVTHISEISADKNQFSAISTAKGLIIKDKGMRRVFSTVNGLPANSAFATLYARNSLFVGTMSGLAQIENGRVGRVFKTSNSELKNNWISALCLAGERIFIGTYGGGVFELLPSGEIRGFEPETGKFFVNPNALYFDGSRLFAGTLDGVRALDLTTQKWSSVKAELPSETVLSIAGDREQVYFGTTAGIARFNKKFWIEN